MKTYFVDNTEHFLLSVAFWMCSRIWIEKTTMTVSNRGTLLFSYFSLYLWIFVLYINSFIYFSLIPFFIFDFAFIWAFMVIIFSVCFFFKLFRQVCWSGLVIKMMNASKVCVVVWCFTSCVNVIIFSLVFLI